MESLGVTLGLLWGHFGATLKLLGGTWGALGDHWELDGTFLGGFWCLEGLLGGPWGELGRVLELISRRHSFLRVKRRVARPKRKREEGARRVQGGCEEGARRVQGGCEERSSRGRKEI